MIFEFDNALVRKPSRSVIQGLSSRSGPRPSYEAVVREHTNYVRALQDCGLLVEILQPLEDFPDSVFVEDPALVYTDVAILLRPGAQSRRGEVAQIEPALRRRFQRVLEVRRGFADGGDVLNTPGLTLIGLSSRTDAEGAAELSGLLKDLGIRSRIVHTPADTLHLKSDCSLIGEEQVLCTQSLAASGIFEGLRTLVVPESERRAANALRVNDSVLIGEEFPLTVNLIRREGYDVKTLPVSEIGKIDAGLSCMSLRWSSRKAPG